MAILVLGMHRSGTSVLTRLLNLLGADVAKNLLGCSEENATGFWESEELVNIHNELLKSAGTSWDDPVQFPSSWYQSPLAPVFQERILRLLRSDFSNSPLFVIKDPRICKLVPFWRRILTEFGATPAVILPSRNPIEVAASLKERNGFSSAKSMLLWMRYVIDAERQTCDLPRSVLSYEQLGKHWRSVMAKISLDLGITWPRRSINSEVEIDGLIQPSLRHFRSATADLQADPNVSSWVKTLYAACQAEEQGEQNALRAAVDKIGPLCDEAEKAYGRMIAESEVAHKSAEAAKIPSIELDELKKQHQELTARLEAEAQTHRKLSAEINRNSALAEQQRTEFAAQIAQLQSQQRTLQNDLAGRTLESARLIRELQLRNSQIELLETQLTDLVSETKEKPGDSTASTPPASIAEIISPADSISIPAPRVVENDDDTIIRIYRRLRGQAPSAFKKIDSADLALIKASPFFDARYYLERYPDIAAANCDPLDHYLSNGAREGRWPHPLFDPTWYVKNADMPVPIENALFDFISRGGEAGCSPHLLFDSRFYLEAYPDVKEHQLNPLLHYLQAGVAEGRNPHPLFSTSCYLNQYPEVAAAGDNPLIDFVQRGMALGRHTHPAFDNEYYLEEYPDVAKAGVHPLIHFLTRGTLERRNPSALFDSREYLRANPDVTDQGFNPLVHYLTRGIAEGRPVRPALRRRSFSENQLPVTHAVDVIIPVYRGLDETRRCIESVIRVTGQNSTPHSIIVLDDCSPEPALSEYLRSLAEQKKIWLITNQKNLGFVGTVNRGMSVNPDRDVVLLNSDTEVANDWLDRLHRAAYVDPDIASVTPFSNNGTICSFPNPNVSNELPGNLTLAEIDAVFASTNISATVDIPTAVGYCMYIRRQALTELGSFDEGAFGKGYGEENDFCMRALKRGWRHVLTADTFIYHKGEVSFAGDSAPGKQAATEVLTSRYPTYHGIIRDYVLSDGAAKYRFAASTALIKRAGKPIVLAISHNRGGGTEKHIRDIAKLTTNQCSTLLLYRTAPAIVRIDSLDESMLLEATFDLREERAELIAFLRGLDVRRIHIHHLLNNELYLPHLMGILHEQFGIPYDVTLHDFFFLAPNPHLINVEGIFVGEPDDENEAILLHTASEMALPESLSKWRKRHHDLLAGAERIIAPSHDTARRFRRYFPDLNVTVAYHPEGLLSSQEPVRVRSLAQHEAMRVVILGALGPEKGIKVVEAVARHAAKQKLPLQFLVIGPTSHKVNSALLDNLLVHGPYKPDELPALLEKSNAHAAWFPAQCPETFCYTLGEAMKAGLPIIGSDLGALSERLAGRPWSWLAPWNQTPETWADLLMAVREHVRRNEPPGVAGKSSPANDHFYPGKFLKWIDGSRG